MRFKPGETVYYWSHLGFVSSFECLGMFSDDDLVFGTHFECIPLHETFKTEEECQEKNT